MKIDTEKAKKLWITRILDKILERDVAADREKVLVNIHKRAEKHSTNGNIIRYALIEVLQDHGFRIWQGERAYLSDDRLIGGHVYFDLKKQKWHSKGTGSRAVLKDAKAKAEEAIKPII